MLNANPYLLSVAAVRTAESFRVRIGTGGTAISQIDCCYKIKGEYRVHTLFTVNQFGNYIKLLFNRFLSVKQLFIFFLF